MPLPESELQWLTAPSTAGNKAFWMAYEIDALCTGLELGRPAKLPAEALERSKALASKLLTAPFPAVAFQSETMLPHLRHFCRELQPELFAHKTAKP